MPILRYIVLVFLGVFLNPVCKSQVLRGHSMPFGLGYAFQLVKDQSVSPVSYSGSLGRINSGYYYQNEKWLSLLDISGFGGFQQPDVNPGENDNRITLIGARASYSLSREVVEREDWRLFAGILSHNVWDYRDVSRYSNSSFNFNGFFSMGIQITLQKEFRLFKENLVCSMVLVYP